MLGTSVDSVRRNLDESGIQVERRQIGPKTRLFSSENVYGLAHFRAESKKSKTPTLALEKPKQLVMTVYAPKGGVGKTTITANLACIFPLLGFKTLVIDLDFQSNLSLALGYDSELTREDLEAAGEPEEKLVEYHFGQLVPQWPEADQQPLSKVIKKPYGEYGPHLIPADISLNDLDTVLAYEGLKGRSSDTILSKFMTDAKAGTAKNADFSDYDIILFDAPPARSRPTINALLASDYVITPVSMEKFSIKALSYLSLVLDEMRADHGRRPSQIIVGNCYSARVRVKQAAIEIMGRYDKAWLDETIRLSESIPKLLSSEERRPISLVNPNDDAASDMRDVALGILEKTGMIPSKEIDKAA